jgi:hypothetical protein
MANGLKAIGRLTTLGGASAPKIGVPTPRVQIPEGKPQFRKPTVYPRGPRILGVGQKRIHRGGPGDPPAGFVDGQSSAVEWYWFWATVRWFQPGRDPRKPPFVGDGVSWDYQAADDPANVRKLASFVSDFVYHLGTGDLIVRIDTFFYHVATTAEQIAKDWWQKLHGGSESVVIVSAYDSDIIGDPSGRAVMAALARALTQHEPVSPVRGGRAFVVRDQIKSVRP